MNTKKLIMLLAAVLLGSVSAFAQRSNNDPLKGDVNEDGTVDVADIAAVIAIIKNNAASQTTYYSYVGTDKSEKLVVAATGALKNDIATQIKSISGVKTYTSIPSSLETGITINAGGDYVYVVAPTATLNNATIYLVNQSNMNIGTETLGTFMIGTTEYKVECTPSEVGTILTAWKNKKNIIKNMTDHTSRNSIEITQNDITSSVLKPSVDLGGVPANGTYTTAQVQVSAGSGINAVDIDWDEADLSSAASSFANAADTAPVSTITTTGELMKEVYSPMFAKAA